ncbi:MAG TPA: hypothetical protein ENH10_03940 [Bacteroidetes bacterium]|nr:hypothetical protein BMS3Bbin04_01796 [bacterium BMS3Bbin04]HDO65169.1 hypothetical protein [Bacteroidota bacterium]HEX04294.1 hypothetical protein [Bacteroidota bacterium]
MRIVISLVVMLLLAGLVLAEIPITDQVGIDMNMRPRLIVDGRDFNSDTGLFDGGDLRTMIGINVMPNDNVLIRVRFRETRFFGNQASLSPSVNDFEAQEAYGKLTNVFGKPMSFTVGRMEYEQGRGRIMGSTSWSPFGPRTYDGIRVGFKPSFGYFEVLVIRALEAGRTDDNLIVVSGNMVDGHFQPIFVADVDNIDYGFEDLNRLYTMGFFYKRMMGDNVKFMMDAAYQMGTMADRTVGSYLIAADVYYKFDGKLNPFVGVGIDMTSGNKWDDDPAKEDSKLFSTPYLHGHGFRGQMDLIGEQQLGLMDLIFHLGIKRDCGLKVMADFHMFSYANDNAYVDNNGDLVEYTTIGQEIDLHVVKTVNENVKLDLGYGVFMASDDWVPDGDAASWGYVSWIFSY